MYICISATVPLGTLGVFDPLLVRFGSLGPLSFSLLRGHSPPVLRLPQLPRAMFCTFFPAILLQAILCNSWDQKLPKWTSKKQKKSENLENNCRKCAPRNRT